MKRPIIRCSGTLARKLWPAASASGQCRLFATMIRKGVSMPTEMLVVIPKGEPAFVAFLDPAVINEVANGGEKT